MANGLQGRSYLPPEEPPFKPSSLAVYSLCMGIFAWTAIPVVGGIIAVALGHRARIEIARSAGKLTGDGMAVVGLVLGYSNIIAAACIVVCIASFFLLPALEQFLS